MSKINYEIALYNSPFFENLVSEFYRISKHKRNIYNRIRNEEDYRKKLSFEERMTLKDLTKKENEIILEILINKQWLNLPIDSKNSIFNDLSDEYKSLIKDEDKYQTDLTF